MAEPQNSSSAEGQHAGVFQTTRWSLVRLAGHALIEDEVVQTLDDRADLEAELRALRAAWL